MHRVFQLLISAAALLTVTSPALAQNSLVEAPSASETRWITQEKATSDCIGDITDPLCAVETLIACWARVEPDLCRQAHDETPDPAPTPDLVPYGAEYKVQSIRILEAKDIIGYLRIAEYRKGFAEVILLRRFQNSESQPNIGWMTYSYYLTPVDDGWRVFGWNINFPRPSPQSEIRTVTPNSSTSDCTGNPATPLCLLDTAVACGVRWEEKLCDQVHGEGFSLPSERIEFESIEYSVVAAHTVKPEDISSTLRLQKLTDVYKPGDVEFLFWLRMRLRDGSANMWDEWRIAGCKMRPAGSRWRATECIMFGFEPNANCTISSSLRDPSAPVKPCWPDVFLGR